MKRLNRLIPSNLSHKAHYLSRLEDSIKLYLPPHQRSAIKVGGIKQGELILLCSNNAHLTSLRFSSKRLCEQINQELDLKLQAIRIKSIYQAIEKPNKAVKKIQKLSRDAATNIQHSADLTTDPELKAALQRLAKQVR